MIERKETKILSNYFNTEPSGASVIIGPEGAGKNTILKTVFHLSFSLIQIGITWKENGILVGFETESSDYRRRFFANIY